MSEQTQTSHYLHCVKEKSIAIVTINRPKALNALNPDVLRKLYDIMDSLDRDRSVKAVIITGAGEKAFVAGANIAAMSTMTPEEALDFAKTGHRTMDRIAAMKKVTIAAINGFALGGGCELAKSCDIRIASTKARMGIPEVTLGLIPGFGGTQRLPRLVGPGMAMELLATGRQVKAEEAWAINLVNRVVKPDELMLCCMEMAQQIAKNSTSAISLGKQCINSGVEMDLARGLEMEQKSFSLAFTTEDQKEGLTAFLEKRQANFK